MLGSFFIALARETGLWCLVMMSIVAKVQHFTVVLESVSGLLVAPDDLLLSNSAAPN